MKLRFLPSLPMDAWMSLWAVAMVVMLGHAVGFGFGWWLWNEDVNAFCLVAFVLLMFTPVEASRRRKIIYFVRPADSQEEFVQVSTRAASRLVADPSVEVHRVYIEDGVAVRGERISSS